MKSCEFTYELSDKAMQVYNNSDFAFWKDADGTIYCSDNQKSEPYEIGTIEDADKFLEQFAEGE